MRSVFRSIGSRTRGWRSSTSLSGCALPTRRSVQPGIKVISSSRNSADPSESSRQSAREEVPPAFSSESTVAQDLGVDPPRTHAYSRQTVFSSQLFPAEIFTASRAIDREARSGLREGTVLPKAVPHPVALPECATCPECEKVLVLGLLAPENKRPFVE